MWRRCVFFFSKVRFDIEVVVVVDGLVAIFGACDEVARSSVCGVIWFDGSFSVLRKPFRADRECSVSAVVAKLRYRLYKSKRPI